MKMYQIINIKNLFDSVKDSTPPIKVAYKVSKLLSEINQEITFYQQKFSEIIAEFGKKDENGNYVYSKDGASIEIEDGKQLECKEKVEELQNIDVNVPDIKFTFDELGSFNFTLGQIEYLMPFIEE